MAILTRLDFKIWPPEEIYCMRNRDVKMADEGMCNATGYKVTCAHVAIAKK